MDYIPRILDLREKLERKSCFLFGPRQTGKSSLVQHCFPKQRIYTLLDSDTFLSLSQSPRRLSQEIQSDKELVIIDEIQKIPSLLDEVHLLIEERGIRFLLTGSSARKLRRGGVNLLGGRARSLSLHPFTYKELQGKFDIMKAVNRGLLPSIYFSDDPEEDLKAYAGDYLKEEIAHEGLTRNIPAFSRFLEVAALCNGRLLNYAALSSDAQVARTTVQEYFHILKDTLIAYDLSPWKKSKKRKPLSTSKLYFFDGGVARHLQHRSTIHARSPEFGEAFETYLFHELRAFSDYTGCGDLYYWRSLSGFEVDFILADSVAVEVKAKASLNEGDLKGLKALQEEGQLGHYILVNFSDRPREIGNIQILPWKDFLDRLWDRKFC